MHPFSWYVHLDTVCEQMRVSAVWLACNYQILEAFKCHEKYLIGIHNSTIFQRI